MNHLARPGLRLATLVLGITLINPARLAAAVKTWDGSSSGNWSVGANWTGGVAPVNGDDVVLPSGAANLTNTNNLSNLRLNSITFTGSGYTVRGNPITIANGISGQQAAGANTFDLDVTLSGTQTFDCVTAGASQTLSGNITNAGFALTLSGSGNLSASGVISGTGGLTKNGAGTLTFSGSSGNSYSGPTLVSAGLLQLSKSGTVAINSGSLTIGSATVLELANTQLGSIPVTINSGGTLDLNGLVDTIGNSLTLNDGTVLTGAGALWLDANPTITVSSTPSISGNLHILSGTCTIQGSGTLSLYANVSGPANIVKNDDVALHLWGTNTFTGSLTANTGGYIYVLNSLALGATNGGTIINDGAYLAITSNYNITNEALTMNSSSVYAIDIVGNSTNTWTGTFTFNTDTWVRTETSCALGLVGPIGGTGGVNKWGPGRLIYSGSSANSYGGLTTVNEGELDLNKPETVLAIPSFGPGLVIGDGSGVDVVRCLNNRQFNSIVTPVRINSSGVLDLNGHTEIAAPLTFNGGQITTGAGLLWLYGTVTVIPTNQVATLSGQAYLYGSVVITNTAHRDSPDLRIDASISGAAGAGLTKTGDGEVELTAANSFSGPATVNNGDLWLANSGALGNIATAVTVNPGGTLVLDGNLTIGAKPLVLSGNGWSSLSALLANRGSSSWAGGVTLSNNTTIEVWTNGAPGATLTLSGLIAGTGGFTKLGPGALALAGTADNAYSGPTVHAEGLLLLANTSGHSINNGTLFIGDGVGGVHADIVRYMAGNNQIQATVPITITNSGWLDLNGHWDDLGRITLSGGDIDSGAAGELRAEGDITVQASSQIANINGHVAFSGGTRTVTVDNGSAFYALQIPATIRDAGDGFNVVAGPTTGAFIRVLGSNSFTGPLLVRGLTLDVETPWGLGSTNGPTVVRGGGELFLFHTGITNEPLTLDTGTLLTGQYDCTWTGPITLTGDATIRGYAPPALFDILGPIGGTGNLTSYTLDTVSGNGTNRFSGAQANTYVGITYALKGTLALNKSVVNGAIPGNLAIYGNLGLARNEQIADSADVFVDSGGLLDFASYYDHFDTLHGQGTVNFGNYGFLNIGANNGTSTFDGTMTGIGYPGGYTLAKDGSGTFTMNGNNTYSNRTEVWNGKLVINGSQPQSPVRVTGGGTLGGSGTVGDIVAAGAVSPGASPGMLTCSNVALTYSGAAGSYFVELTGPTPGADYDQLNVRGTNNLANAGLNINLAFTKPVAVGQQFTIINNDGADPITGIFAGYTVPTTYSQNGYAVAISYTGGSGNDVVLTLVEVPAAQAGYAATSGNGNGTLEPNECASLGIGITNKTGTAMTGITATLSSADPNAIVTQPFSTYSSAPANGKSTNNTPFQISVLPSFVCGNSVNLQLAVSSSSHGSFIVPVVLPSGVPSAAPVRYDNNTVTNVPDIGTIESTNTVATWSGGPITKVAVSLWLVAPSDTDLNLTLIAPDGTSVDLSSGNGAGANFGTGNADASRTTFDDAAATSITAGTPPFVGSFRPEGALASLLGTTATGNWRLRIQDNFGIGSPDTLRAWSLFLYGTTCAPGGGACALCAGGTLLTNTLDTTSASMTTRLTRSGIVSTCAAPKTCPGASTGSYYYQAYPFYNASSNTCVTVTLTSLGSGDLMSVAYLGEFTPGDVCLNYLADGGLSTGGVGTNTYSFYVPPNSLFTVVVNHVGALGAYSLAVSGGDCPPILNIPPLASRNVGVSWPTVAGGYQLESSLSLVTPTVWTTVANEPIAASDRFNVTNSASSSSNRFYRLHKP
jgi:autotransporter-associated beta strand protein